MRLKMRKPVKGLLYRRAGMHRASTGLSRVGCDRYHIAHAHRPLSAISAPRSYCFVYISFRTFTNVSLSTTCCSPTVKVEGAFDSTYGEMFRVDVRSFERSPVPLFTINDQNVIIAASYGWLGQLGYARDNVIGQPISAFWAQGPCAPPEPYQLVMPIAAGRSRPP